MAERALVVAFADLTNDCFAFDAGAYENLKISQVVLQLLKCPKYFDENTYLSSVFALKCGDNERFPASANLHMLLQQPRGTEFGSAFHARISAYFINKTRFRFSKNNESMQTFVKETISVYMLTGGDVGAFL